MAVAEEQLAQEAGLDLGEVDPGNIVKHIARTRKAMLAASEALEFETAAKLRDELTALERLELRYR